LLSAQIGQQFNSVFLKDGINLYYNINRLYFNQIYSKFIIKLNTLNDNYFPTKGILFESSLKYTNNIKSGTVLDVDPIYTNNDSIDLMEGVKDFNILFNLKYKQYILIKKHFSIIPELEIATRLNPAFITEKYFIGGMNYSLRAKSYNFPGIKENHFSADYFTIVGIEAQLKFLNNWYVFGGTHQLIFGNYIDYDLVEEEFEGNTITSWNVGLGLQTKIGPIRIIYSKQYDNKANIWSLNIGVPF
jgi:outer membrane protein assembly factor BamA